MAKKLVVGNWKLNPSTYEEGERMLKALSSKKISGVTVAICPPSVFLSRITSKKRSIFFGVQNIFYESAGAFTGEISASQAKSVKAHFAIIGHSERRAMGETNAVVAKKVQASLRAGLHTILCIGEKERDVHGHYLSYLKAQIDESLDGLSKSFPEKLIIAYEPIWAIGEKSAGAMEPRDLYETVIFIRKVLHDRFGKRALQATILYGGSVDPANTARLISEGSVNGLLVGRQSLRPDNFLQIIQEVGKAK
jgi:triosephosphate isomerase